MSSFKTFAAAGVIGLALFAAGNAGAADLPMQHPMPLPPPPPIEFGGGWYLRGDVGVSSYDRVKFSSQDGGAGSYYGEELGSGGFAGGGVGYQFNKWFRADLTGEYRFSTGMKGHDKFSDGYGTYRNAYEGSFDAAVGMINGYIDLGHWYGITPFIGAGVGITRNRLYGLKESAINDIYATPFFAAYTGVSGGDITESTKTGLAWALHAGLAYDVTPNFKVEIAYRYMNLGDAKTGAINCFCGSTFSGIKVKEIESHDVKLGMRWVLGSAPAPIGDMPLVRRY